QRGEGATRRIEKAIAVIKPKVNLSCDRWMSAVILRRIMRFIRSLLLAALAVCEFKLEAVNVGDRQGYITSQIYLLFLLTICRISRRQHEGESIGHRASHGCIRMPHDFAVRLYHLTKLNTRVIIANSELKATEFADPHLFAHKEIPPEVASPVDPVDNGVEPVVAKSAQLAVHANTRAPGQSDVGTPQAAPPAMKPDQKTESVAPGADAGASGVAAPPTSPTPTDLAKVAAAKQMPISIFISRKRQRLYIRQDFTPLFDAAVTIAQPDAPLGTQVFTALEFTG